MKSNYKKPEAGFIALSNDDVIQTSLIEGEWDDDKVTPWSVNEPVTLTADVNIFEG